jgi:antitoxin FitA
VQSLQLIIGEAINVRNLSEETHRALRVRAAIAGRSTEAEVRAILVCAARPEAEVKLGSLLAEIGQRAGGFELEITRDKPMHYFAPARALMERQSHQQTATHSSNSNNTSFNRDFPLGFGTIARLFLMEYLSTDESIARYSGGRNLETHQK